MMNDEKKRDQGSQGQEVPWAFGLTSCSSFHLINSGSENLFSAVFSHLPKSGSNVNPVVYHNLVLYR
jgi:hypothetical protein